MIDLRSDTITRPTPQMRSVMANAPVGDDVYHDDPTVNALEEHVATILGVDAAMYVPSGTMSNQIAVRLHTEPGDSVVIEHSAHIGTHELGGAAHHSGVTLNRIKGSLGVFTAMQLMEAVPVPHPSMPFHLYDPHTLMCLENTHNLAGGTVWPIEQLRSVTAAARDLGLVCHLDGARIWNASIASGVDIAEYASLFDTVSVCFSKGLGAPVGSALCGSAEAIAQARRFKHMFGGGFRQAGVIAAGALYALANHRDRLIEDHDNARTFAEGIAGIDGVTVDLTSVQTNIVNFTVAHPGAVVDACLTDGLAVLVNGPSEIRAVFSMEVDASGATEAIGIVADAVAQRGGGP
ncbi:MAG: threonine aldolase family protein [Acidimicrobiia bacterium]